MKKKYHLLKNKDFKNIIKKQKKINDVFLIFYEINSEKNSKIGISVSKKIGNAVVRNKIKRQIRSMITNIFDLEIKKNYLIICRENYLKNDYSTNFHKLEKLYKGIKE